MNFILAFFALLFALIPETYALTSPFNYYSPAHFPNNSKRSNTFKAPKAGLPWSGKDWRKVNSQRIKENVEQFDKLQTQTAKNVILFLADGMGLSTVAATRIHKAQEALVKPEENYLVFETFPFSGLSRTYSVDRTTPDSASTATAYLCGVKTNLKTIGVKEEVEYGSCEKFNSENKVASAAKEALKKGKWVGIVTTSRVTDASPAAVYAHTPNRSWEAVVPSACKDKVKDLADQLITEKDHENIRVVLGGGRSKFKKERKDDRDLIEEWKKLKEGQNASYVSNEKEFSGINPNVTDHLLGLFSDEEMSYMPGVQDKDQPSLLNMTTMALQILARAPKGFFLFVEGGRIDHAHHENKASRAINETLAFEEAVGGAMEMIDSEDTLVVVTADHSHVMTLGGYGEWKEPVLGLAYGLAKDKKTFLQINYANGPSYQEHRMDKLNGKDVEIPRRDIKKDDMLKTDYQQDTGIWMSSETHAGEDVPVYSIGPWAHLFQATEEQTYIAHAMQFAACLGDYASEKHCAKSSAPAIN